MKSIQHSIASIQHTPSRVRAYKQQTTLTTNKNSMKVLEQVSILMLEKLELY